MEAFPSPYTSTKISYFMALEMNKRYKLEAKKDFHLAKEELLSVRRAKCEETIKIVDLCDI